MLKSAVSLSMCNKVSSKVKDLLHRSSASNTEEEEMTSVCQDTFTAEAVKGWITDDPESLTNTLHMQEGSACSRSAPYTPAADLIVKWDII